MVAAAAEANGSFDSKPFEPSKTKPSTNNVVALYITSPRCGSRCCCCSYIISAARTTMCPMSTTITARALPACLHASQ